MSYPCRGRTRIALTWSCRIVLAIGAQVRSGRGIRRLVTLCGSITELVAENDRRLFAAEGIEDDDEEGEQTPEDLQDLAQR